MEGKRNASISAFGAFALSIGTAIGWGSFVVTGSSFLSKAGPMGSIIGLLIGFLIMIVVAVNYSYMINKYPNDNGGIFCYAKNTLGGDHAFLVSWFLVITYFAILCANLSSISLFARYIFGDIFQFGFHYNIGGYDVWFGEVLLPLFFIIAFGGICLLKKSISTKIQFALVLVFLVVIVGGCAVAVVMHQGGIAAYKPDFAPVGINESLQTLGVISMVPWAYIGFESVSHSSKNFKFPHKRVLRVLIASLIAATVLYISVCIISISAFPEEYSNWYEYLTGSSSLSGLEGIPPFYVIHRFLGTPGLVLFVVSLLAIILTSLIGNIFGLSNLIQSMAQNNTLPGRLAKTDEHGNSRSAVFSIVIAAACMLFLGRVLIVWIVDVNTFCGMIVYIYIAIIAFVQAKKEGDKRHAATGAIGIALGVVFSVSIAISSIVQTDFLEKESIFIFLIWAVVGFTCYGIIIRRDRKKELGHSMIALFGLYFLIIYVIGSWLIKMVMGSTETSEIITGILISVIVLIATQTVFFLAFSVIRKREVDMQENLVVGMATMIEGRDNLTGSHIKRTSDIVKFIVEEMKKDESGLTNHIFLQNVIKAAPMHDLGKITIDDQILRKPGRFTPEEFEIMKTHSAEGARIIREILKDTNDVRYLEVAVNIANYHHEKWDGSGYPEGLKGEEIPLEARIMAVADVYDALVSKRTYKEAFSFEEADRIILEGMGTHFDPSLQNYYERALGKIEEYYRDQLK